MTVLLAISGSPRVPQRTPSRIRGSLLASVAAGALLLAAPPSARAQVVPPAAPCNSVAGTTVTCTGNISAGVAITSPTPYTVLNVSGLTQNIAPAVGKAGISFTLNGSATTDLTIISDTGDFAINTTDSGAPFTRPNGIDAKSESLTGNLTIHSTGTINSGGDFGIAAYLARYGSADQAARGDVLITSNGAVSGTVNGIRAMGQLGTVTVGASGTVTSVSGGGILANGGAQVIVNNYAGITAAQYGIFANSPNSATVHSTGDIRITGLTPPQSFYYSVTGISVASARDITVTASGSISVDPRLLGLNNVRSYGIAAVSSGGGTASGAAGLINIDTSADITARTGVWVVKKPGANSYDNIAVTNSGTITATRAGLYALVCPRADSFACGGNYARPAGDTITFTNTVTGVIHSDGTGMVAVGDFLAGGMSIVNDGEVEAAESAIFAWDSGKFDYTRDTIVSITNSGKLGSGVGVSSGYHAIAVRTSGDAMVSNTGSVISAHRSALNVFGDGPHSDVTVTNSGYMSSGATDYAGHHYSYAAVNIIAYKGTADVTNEASGQIDTAAQGIQAIATTINVSNAGIITTGLENGVQGSGGATGFDGIAVIGYGGTINLSNSGTINSVGNGIAVESWAYYHDAEKLTVTSSGSISAAYAGITATSMKPPPTRYGDYVSGPVMVRQTGGSIDAALEGIIAQSDAGPVTVEQTAGKITAGYQGIRAYSKDGAVSVTQTGGIITALRQGIFAYSISGNVTVETAGQISAAQDGVFATSQGGHATVQQSGGTITSTGGSGIRVAGSANLSVEVAGSVIGAAGFAGATFGDGASNSLTVASTGVVHNAGGINALAVSGGSGNEAIHNAGTITGSVSLGAGQNSFDNLAGGVFAMGSSVSLGAGNALTNRGTLSPGGSGAVSTVSLSGNLVQEAGGTLAIDIDGAASSADRINLSGSAILAGTVKANLLNPVSTSQQFTILSAEGGVTASGLTLSGGLPVSFRILYPTPNDVVLGATVNLNVGGLNDNQISLTDNLNTIIDGGLGGVAPVINALIGISDRNSYKDALNQLLPEPYLQAAMSAVAGAEAFSGTLMGCTAQPGAHPPAVRDHCLWADAGASELTRDETEEYLGAREDVRWFSGGAETALSPNLRLGMGARYERSSQDVNDSAHTDADRAQLGASLAYSPGPLLFGAAIAAGHGWLDTERNLSFNGFSGHTTADYDTTYLHGKLRAEYRLNLDGWSLTPRLDGDVTRISHGDVTEHGGNGAALRISGTDQTVVSVSPSAEIAGNWQVGDEWVLKPFARGGATFYGDTTFSTESRFRSAPAGTSGFATDEAMDQLVANISAGMDVIAPGGTSLRFFYEGMLGETTHSNGGGLRAAIKF